VTTVSLLVTFQECDAMSKLPLQAIVVVICDHLCELSEEDCARAFKAVLLSFGLDRTSAPTSQPKRPDQQTAEVVIYDVICQLPVEDRARALEAVRITLGLDQRLAPTLRPAQPARIWEEGAPRLPMVEVQMVNGGPVVVGQPGDQQARGLVVVTPQRDLRRQPLALRAPTEPAQTGRSRGYVRPPR
jgi:hypothetical protein